MSSQVIKTIIDPALEELAGPEYKIPVSRQAKAMLYAIGMQESQLKHRFQIPLAGAANAKGPARGLWQFEAKGGVNGVLNHTSTKSKAKTICQKYVGSTEDYAVWATLEYNDKLAAMFARLLLWTDPKALPEPTVANEQAAWEYYERNWRPGKPHREAWGKNWKEAVKVVGV